MNPNFKITYTYQHKETGSRLQRTFTLSEIKAGEDDAHLAIIPGYELIGISCPLCDMLTEALNKWHEENDK